MYICCLLYPVGKWLYSLRLSSAWILIQFGHILSHLHFKYRPGKSWRWLRVKICSQFILLFSYKRCLASNISRGSLVGEITPGTECFKPLGGLPLWYGIFRPEWINNETPSNSEASWLKSWSFPPNTEMFSNNGWKIKIAFLLILASQLV